MISSSAVLKRLGLTDVSKDLGEFPRLVPWFWIGQESPAVGNLDGPNWWKLTFFFVYTFKVLVLWWMKKRVCFGMWVILVEGDVFFEITWWSHPFAYTNTFRRRHISSLGSNCFDHQNLCIIHNVLSVFRVILLSATPREPAMQDDTWSCKTCPLKKTGKCHHILLEFPLFSANFHLERVGSASGLLASTLKLITEPTGISFASSCSKQSSLEQWQILHMSLNK